MQIAFDPAKNAANIAKHGLSLAQANGLDWTTLQVKPDLRHDYGELRQIGLAIADTQTGQRLFCVVFVDRDEVRRIISLRKANDREVGSYAADY
jgi:uncharacterized protein